MAENIIFISYRQSTCKAEAAYLHKSILAQDNTRTVFWDFASIPAGTKWKQCFLDNIGQASLVVLLVSKATIETFEDIKDPDNLLLEWDIAVGRYLEGNLKILPVFFLDGDEKDFDFRGVQLRTTVADGCGRSFKEIWKEISQIQGIKVHFSHVHDMEALDIRINNLIPITTATTLSQPAPPVISESIDEPRIFIGREDVLEKLSLWFADTTKGAAVIFFGGPGIGKTTVATHFISICSDSLKYSHILLVSLVSEYTFQDTVIDCCKTVGIPLDDDFEKNKGAFFNWLKKNKSYLIVVDNADDKDITKKCFGKLSKFSGHVLITSRNPAIDEYIPLGVGVDQKNRLEITIWPDEITQRYVNSRLDSRLPKTDSEKDYLEKILKFLNGYPLIVEQMCSFMADDHGRSFEKYYELLDLRSQQIWDQEPEPAMSRYQRTIDATFGIVIRHFQQTGNRAACIVLGAIGCVSNTSIPIDTYLRQYLVKAGIDVEIESVVSSLIKVSLLKLDEGGKSVSIHLAIQDVIRRTLDSAEYLDTTFSDFAVTVMDKILPKRNSSHTFESSTISIGTVLLPHIVELHSRSQKHDSELATLHFNAGDFAKFIGSYEIAKRLYTLPIEIYSKLNGRDSQNVARAINYLGDIAIDQGDYAEAKKLYNESLDIYEKGYGTRQHANIAITINYLGDIAKSQGDYAEAKKLYNESLDIFEKVYGTRQHASIAVTINNLGDIAKKQGELDKALKLHLEALVIFKRIYETTYHADIAGIMFYIGETFEAMDDFEKAKLNYEQSLEIFKKVFGVDHDWCLVVSGALENLKFKKKDVEGLTAISSNLEVREKDSEMLQLSITEPEEEFSEAIGSKGNVNVLDHVEAPVDVSKNNEHAPEKPNDPRGHNVQTKRQNNVSLPTSQSRHPLLLVPLSNFPPSRTPLKSRSAPFEPAFPTENLNKENSINGSDLHALEPKKTPSKMSELGGVWTPKKKGSTVAAAKLFSSPKSKGTKSLKRKIEKIVEQNADSEEDSSDDEDEEFGGEELNEEMIKNTADDEEDDDPNSLSNVYNASQEQYFAANKTNSKTSNNTLAKLPQLELSDFHKIRPLLTLKHKKEIEELNFWHEELFVQWVFELTLGDFNLMFYGYGSKINLFSKFVDKYLIDAPVVVVNGFFPSISIREILLQIVQGILQLPDVPASPPELLATIEYYFEDDNRELEKLYVVIHNIDGSNLRNEKSQSYLSQLASISNIHLIASIDQINSPLLWDSAATCRFNFVWHDVTNFTPYITESSFENNFMDGVSNGAEEINLRAGIQVLKSVNENARKLFMIVEKHQTETEHGIMYDALLERCREQFIASNAAIFRSLLTEYRDHKVLVNRETADGEILVIPMQMDAILGVISWLNEK